MTKSGSLSQTEHLLQVLNKKNKSNTYIFVLLHVWFTSHTTKVAASIKIY